MAERFDLVVIGAGPGGYVAAIRAAQLGKRVACVDRRASLGGTCLNVGCIPSKALLDSSELFAQARTRFAQHGIRLRSVELDLPAMMARKQGVVKGLTDGIAYLFKKNGVKALHGTARLVAADRVAVRGAEGAEEVLNADAVLLATGSEPSALAALPFDGRLVVSSTEALGFNEVPAHLLVVGAGYIGLEIGSIWARLGSQVSVLEFLPRLLPQADTELATHLHRALVKQGLAFHFNTNVTGASCRDEKVVVSAQVDGNSREFTGSRVLVAAGRRPCIAGLGLEEIGVKSDQASGRIAVNDSYGTSVAGVYAIGDLIAGPMLAHKAEDEGIVFAERLSGMKSQVNYAAIPSVVYTFPELASVGLTEEQVKGAGGQCRVGKFPFSANGRARCLGEAEGLVKVVADARTDRILGIHILGPRASDLIAEAVAFMEFTGSAEDIARTCHAHPTLTEALREAALAVEHRAIHA